MESQEILHDIFFVILYGGVIMLNLVAAVYLLLRRGNAIAPDVTSPVRLRRWAAIFLIACAISHILWLIYTYSYYPAIIPYMIVCGLDLVLIFPSIVGILLSMLQDRRRPFWPFLIMMVPAVVLVIINVFLGSTSLGVAISAYVVLLCAMLIVFVFFAVRRYGLWLRDNYADLERKEVWQSVLILVLFLLFFVVYSVTTGRSRIMAYLLQIYSVILVGLLIWRVETLQELSGTALPDGAESSDDEDDKVSATPQAIPASIGPLLKKQCEDGQLYLEHDLSLAQLAQTIGTNRYYLSQYFAQQGMTYNTYINNLRIRHFTSLYHKAVEEGRSFTAKQLAFESGYYSYSTFSAVFKQHTGKTVTAWMRGTSD